MRKLLGTLMIGIMILTVVGLFRGWFSLAAQSEAEQTKIELTIDREQLKQDTQRLKEGVQDLTQSITSGSDDSEAAAESSANQEASPF